MPSKDEKIMLEIVSNAVGLMGDERFLAYTKTYERFMSEWWPGYSTFPPMKMSNIKEIGRAHV